MPCVNGRGYRVLNKLTIEYQQERLRLDSLLRDAKLGGYEFAERYDAFFTVRARLSHRWHCLRHALYNVFVLSRKGLIEITEPGDLYRAYARKENV